MDFQAKTIVHVESLAFEDLLLVDGRGRVDRTRPASRLRNWLFKVFHPIAVRVLEFVESVEHGPMWLAEFHQTKAVRAYAH
jgi:hypothetical protein